MSREHFHESQIEDKVEQFMQEGMSDEDAIQKAESEYHGQVNLVEDQALKIHQEDKEDEQALRIHEKAYEMNKEEILKELEQEKKDVEIRKKLRQSWYPSEIVLAMVVEHLQKHYNNENEIRSTRQFCRNLLTKINDDTLEVANAE